MRTVTSHDLLRARAVAYALLARILGPDARPITDPETIRALRDALSAAGEGQVLAIADAAEPVSPTECHRLAGRWVRWFDLGRVAPYEGSNVASSAGGVTPRLADIAGFYRAFNVAVHGDRPDHVVAQLEFLALALLAEAEAVELSDVELADVAAEATRSFVRDHAGCWIDAWAARVGAVDELAPWWPYASAAAELVRSEAIHRNVIPVRDAAVLWADAGVIDDNDEVPTCSDTWSDRGMA